MEQIKAALEQGAKATITLNREGQCIVNVVSRQFFSLETGKQLSGVMEAQFYSGDRPTKSYKPHNSAA